MKSILISSVICFLLTATTVFADNVYFVGAGVNANSVLKSSYVFNQSAKVSKEDLGFNLFAKNVVNNKFSNEIGIQKIGKVKLKSKYTSEKISRTYHVYYDIGYQIPLFVPSFEGVFSGGVGYVSQHINGKQNKSIALNYNAAIQYNFNKVAVRARYIKIIPTDNLDEVHPFVDTVNFDVIFKLI